MTGYLLERWPAITIAVLVILLVILVTWKVACYYHKIESARKKVESAPCQEHEKKLDKLEESNKIIAATHDIVIEIGRWISKRDKKMIDLFVSKGSPYLITNIGFQLLEMSGGKKVIDNNLEFFIHEIRELNPKTPYDAEDYAFSVVLKNIGNEIFNPVKNFIYYSPEKIEMHDPDANLKIEVHISMEGILNVMSIYLRDKYIEENPTIGILFDIQVDDPQLKTENQD